MDGGSEVAVLEFERMFLGDLPWTFTLEVMFRTTAMYVYTLALVRVLGKRGMGQLAPVELVIIIALGSAVGDPMFYADVPLVHGFAVITTIVVLHRGLAVAMSRSDLIDRTVESGPVCVVQQGTVLIEAVQRERLPVDELFAALREEGFENLGEVRVAYLEGSGQVSAFRFTDSERRRFGLSLHPGDGGQAEGDGPPFACCRCGEVASSTGSTSCPRCERVDPWVPAARVQPSAG